MITTSPVLLLIYNRPEVTKRVFNAVRRVRPKQLFIAGDGPNHLYSDDGHLVSEARSTVNEVDWPCEVRTLFRSNNLGLKRAVGDAITWFFENVEEGIILEDDCLPHEDFFVFCDELLKHHRNDDNVAVITGNNFQNGKLRGEATYYYSCFPHVWGWATWRRSWSSYDASIAFWPSLRTSSNFRRIFPNSRTYKYWRHLLDSVFSGNFPTTWAAPWTASVWRNGGLTATPNVNLVSNIGFGPSSTHTTDADSGLSNIPTAGIGQLRHPLAIIQDMGADAYTFSRVYRQKFVLRH